MTWLSKTLFSLSALGGLCSSLASTDLPLGVIKHIASEAEIIAEMQAPHELEIDDMVAIYGPGALTKNPLTDKVIREDRTFVGRALVVGGEGNTIVLRPTWTAEGAALAAGFDVVPTPGEASPDGPPRNRRWFTSAGPSKTGCTENHFMAGQRS